MRSPRVRREDVAELNKLMTLIINQVIKHKALTWKLQIFPKKENNTMVSSSRYFSPISTILRMAIITDTLEWEQQKSQAIKL